MEDYRCTPFCPAFENIKEEKRKFLARLQEVHPKVENIYKCINKRNTEEHRLFFEIYHNKCCYCGCSIDILSAQNFEIDHLKPLAQGQSAGNNSIENLVLACRTCNSGKRDFWVSEISDKWSPDNGGITQLFYRDELYNICIEPRYQSNAEVKELYRRLKLGMQWRRLDYLLMLLDGYIRTLLAGTNKRAVLLEIFQLLQKKRNYIGI